MELKERNETLKKEVQRYVNVGYQIKFMSDTTAQLVRPKQFNGCAATLWFLCFGVGVLIYIFYYMTKTDEIVNIIIDENGKSICS
jgi:hypothetical protein